MTVPTSRPVFEHLEVVETGRRRRWTEDEKLRIVAESLSAALVRPLYEALRHHVLSAGCIHGDRHDGAGIGAEQDEHGTPLPLVYVR